MPVHGKLFVSIAIRNYFLRRLPQDEVEKLCLVAIFLLSKSGKEDTNCQIKTNQRYKYKFENLVNTGGSVQG